MQYEFLKIFQKRMKKCRPAWCFIQNSIQKTSWKQFGFLKFDEQMNLIFAVMLLYYGAVSAGRELVLRMISELILIPSIPGIWVKKFPMMTAEN